MVPTWAAAAWTSLTTALILPGIPGAAAESKQAICLARHWSEVEADFIQWPICVESRWERTAPRITQGAPRSPDQIVSVTISEGSPSTTAIPAPSGQPDHEIDTDSPLDNSNFLSFEDWKKQNLAKVGQSAENVRGHRHAGGKDDRRRPTGINNALDSLGEDAEIELDFGGFGADASDAAKPTSWGASLPTAGITGAGAVAGAEDAETSVSADLRKAASRGKDAGTTCKERFNYASFDCAATVLKTNPECKGSSSVLVENKDSYMLNECRAKNKFLILELCDDILVDTVVLANYEFFSSIFHTFRVSVADRYPAKIDQWRELGVYEARNTREIQAFAVENPLIWARYVKIEFLTHYGNEFYCPLSLVRIHGTTMLEEYKHDGDTNRADEEAAVEALEPSPLPVEPDVRDVAQQPPTTVAVSDEPAIEPTVIIEAQGSCSYQGIEVIRLLQQGVSTPVDTCDIRTAPTGAGNDAANQLTESRPKANEETTPSAEASVPVSRVDPSDKGSVGGQKVTGPPRASPDSASSMTQGTETVRQDATHESEIKSVSSPKEESSISPESVRPSGTQPPSSNPTTQESFFKSVNKRLQMLESNSTLSLLYIEEQSRILRDAFSKVEKRQLAKTSTFLENLNVTVLNELRQFREQYDQVWKSVALEFEHQRIQYHQEIHSISAQLGVLADELVFQKRVSVIQSIMILFCFALVLFSRVPVGTYIDIPRVQNMMNRSYSLRSSSPIFFGSPSASPSSTRPTSSYRPTGRHRRNMSEDSQEEPLSPTIAYSPPTPTSDPPSPDEVDKRPAPSLDTVSMPDLAPPHFRSHSSPPVLNPADEESPSEESPISYESRGSSDYDSPGSTESSEPILASNNVQQEG